MPLPENIAGIQAIKEALEPRILGQEKPGFSCSCGAVHCATATAAAIEPAGDRYPGQETKWFLWLVRMEAKPEVRDPFSGEPARSWSCDLSYFVPMPELEELFRQHFGDDAL